MTKRATATVAFPPLKRVQTTLTLDPSLWRQAKMRALDERTNLRDILTRALEHYLTTPVPTRRSS